MDLTSRPKIEPIEPVERDEAQDHAAANVLGILAAIIAGVGAYLLWGLGAALLGGGLIAAVIAVVMMLRPQPVPPGP